MKDLIEKLEAADGPRYALDVGIFEAVNRRKPRVSRMPQIDPSERVPNYTASIDAALTLVPENWFWTCGRCDLSGHVTIGPDFNGPHGEALKKTHPEHIWHEGISIDIEEGKDRTARAICIAALKAREDNGGDEHG